MNNTGEFELYLFDDEITRKKSSYIETGSLIEIEERNEVELQKLSSFLGSIPLGSSIRFCITFEPLPVPSEGN